jgi:hypothetical protein
LSAANSRCSHLMAHFSPSRWLRIVTISSTIWSSIFWLPSSGSQPVEQTEPSFQRMTARGSRSSMARGRQSELYRDSLTVTEASNRSNSIQGTCPGVSGTDPVNGFRIGKDGNTAPLAGAAQTLPQPYYPGQLQNGIMNLPAGDGTVLDPKTKPDRFDQFNFTIQRALSSKLTFEVGYIGRIIRHEYQPVDLDSIDTRLTLNGQSLSGAWANLYNAVNMGAAVSSQPFFEAALGGPGSAYCSGSARDVAAVLKEWLSRQGGAAADPVFPSSSGGRLSADAFQRLVSRHIKTACRTCPSLTPKKVTPHPLRHAAAMALLHRGVDLSVIALWLSHESTETTQIYLHADMQLKERALAHATSSALAPDRFRPPNPLLAFLESL